MTIETVQQVIATLKQSPESPDIRCAIYTRKSADEGLDAAFTTLDNQRDYCSKYIASQAGEGWIELPVHFDDGGWSGGNLKRPALTQLRADIEAVPVDVQVMGAPGKVGVQIVGLPDTAVAESRERVQAALQASGLSMLAKKVTVNLAPADLLKEGSH